MSRKKRKSATSSAYRAYTYYSTKGFRVIERIFYEPVYGAGDKTFLVIHDIPRMGVRAQMYASKPDGAEVNRFRNKTNSYITKRIKP